MKKENQIVIDKDKLKNGIIIVLILIIVFGASFMATGVGNDNTKSNETETKSTDEETISNATKAQEESAAISAEEQKDLEEINVDRYIELKEESNPSVIYIARPTCHFCEIQGPIIKNVAYEHDLTIHYLNTDEMSDEESTSFINSDDAFKEGFGTPCTIVVKDGKITGQMEGLVDRETMVNFFKEQGIIS